MNNTTPIKILTAAVLLTFGFALTANAALINKGVTEMNHEYTVSDTLSARQQVIPLIAASMASSQMDKLNAALNQSRELATVGALAATPGVEAQLLSHTRASLRVGLTAAQLRQLAQVLREHGDNDAATRADEALQKALENK